MRDLAAISAGLEKTAVLAAGLAAARRGGTGFLGPMFRHMANLAPGQPTTARSVAKAVFAPNYPLLHRRPGTLPAPTFRGNLPHHAGNAVRLGGLASIGASAPVVWKGMTEVYPRRVGMEIARAAGESDNRVDQAGTAMQREGPGAAMALGRTWLADRLPTPLGRMLGANQHPLQRAVADSVGEVALPAIRNDMHLTRQAWPGFMNSVDAMRSVTPFGAAMTAALRNSTSPEAPDVTGAFRRNLTRHAPGILADPHGALASPVAQSLGRVLDPRNRAYDADQSVALDAGDRLGSRLGRPNLGLQAYGAMDAARPVGEPLAGLAHYGLASTLENAGGGQ